nr:putative Gag-polypeptide of LTR copia-type [Tanacetum cinerariifolium]
MIRVAIGGKSKALLSHLTSDPPEQSSETYEQWEQEDLIVFSWLIQNIEPTLAGNLTKYHTAKTLWDALVITYNSGRDKLHTFNLHSSVSSLLATPIGGMMATRIEDRKEAKASLPTPTLIKKVPLDLREWRTRVQGVAGGEWWRVVGCSGEWRNGAGNIGTGGAGHCGNSGSE